MTNDNPLLQSFDFPPFSKIKNKHYKPAFLEAIKLAQKEIDAIVVNKAKPTFENTISALEYSGETLGRVAPIFFNLNQAETNDELQQIAQDVMPALTKFQNDITLNGALFKRVKTVYEQRKQLDLTPEQQTLLDKHYKSFSRNGANLKEDKKKELRQIDTKLAQLGLQFGQNVLAETNNFELQVIDRADIKGLPESAKQTAAALAKSKGKEGFIFTLQFPSYLPFMKYVANRDLRKKMAIAYGAKGFQNNDFNNENNVLEIAKLRFQRAKLLGYASHAAFVLEERMAKTPEKVNDFLQDLLEKALPAAKSEFVELAAFAKEEDDIDQLQKWDSAYYSEKLKQKKFDLEDEKLKPYFPLDSVLRGAFNVANKLYGISFKEVGDIEKYHPEVRTFKVLDENNKYLATFYGDFHPHEGKRNGAWMTTFKEQQQKEGVNERPQASIVCNFSRPTENTPALLTFNEVTTLFHEFGHSLHAMLADTVYPSLASPNVYWDFVELPSQIMENWCYEQETLELFAKHYVTGELIPMDLIKKIKAAAQFQEGMQTVRQLSFGFLDMAWHGIKPSDVTDVKAHEKEAFSPTQLLPDVSENCMSTAFGHIFQGGYSAGYYSYKWAEVLDADAFAYFKENGIFDKVTAAKFRNNVLSKGGSEDPMILYKQFRGQEPNPEALLKRAGLIT